MKEVLSIDIGDTFLGPNHFLTETSGVGQLVSSAVAIALVVASIILFFLFIFGGIGMIAGAGSNNPERAAKGKQAVTAALVGFIIVFVAYWIVQLIELITGVEILA